MSSVRRKLLISTWKSISSEMEAQGVQLFVEYDFEYN